MLDEAAFLSYVTDSGASLVSKLYASAILQTLNKERGKTLLKVF